MPYSFYLTTAIQSNGYTITKRRASPEIYRGIDSLTPSMAATAKGIELCIAPVIWHVLSLVCT